MAASVRLAVEVQCFIVEKLDRLRSDNLDIGDESVFSRHG